MNMTLAFAFGVAACAALPAAALAETVVKREALYDVALDMDRDGKMDRAVLVLVGPGRTDFDELTKDRYGVGEGERVDLHVYLGAGDVTPDVSQKPSFTKQNIVDLERTNWVLQPEARGQGSLVISAAYGWGARKSMGDSITIIYRDGSLQVAGYTLDWEWATEVNEPEFDVKTSDGICDINFLSGRGDVSFNGDAKKPLKGKFKAVSLADWSAKTRPMICDSMMSLAIDSSVKN